VGLLLVVAVVVSESDLVPEGDWAPAKSSFAQESSQGFKENHMSTLENLRSLKAYCIIVKDNARQVRGFNSMKKGPLVQLILRFGLKKKKNIVREYANIMGKMKREFKGVNGYVLRYLDQAVVSGKGVVKYSRTKGNYGRARKSVASFSFHRVGLVTRPKYFKSLEMPWSMYLQRKAKVNSASSKDDSYAAASWLLKKGRQHRKRFLRRIKRRAARNVRARWKVVARSALRGQLQAWKNKKMLRPGVPRGISDAQKVRNKYGKLLNRVSKRGMRAQAKRKALRWMRRHKLSIAKLIKNIERKQYRKRSRKIDPCAYHFSKAACERKYRKARKKFRKARGKWRRASRVGMLLQRRSLRSRLLEEAKLAGKAAAAAAARKGGNSAQIRKAVGTAARTAIWAAFMDHAKKRAHAAAKLAIKVAIKRHLSHAAQQRAAKKAAATIVQAELTEAHASQHQHKTKTSAAQQLNFAEQVMDETADLDQVSVDTKPPYHAHGRRRRRAKAKAKAKKKVKKTKAAKKKAAQKAKKKAAKAVKKAAKKKAKAAKKAVAKAKKVAKKATKKHTKAKAAKKKAKAKIAKKHAKAKTKRKIKAVAKAAKKAAKKASKKLKKATKKAKKASKVNHKTAKMKKLKKQVKIVAKKVKNIRHAKAKTNLKEMIRTAVKKAAETDVRAVVSNKLGDSKPTSAAELP